MRGGRLALGAGALVVGALAVSAVVVGLTGGHGAHPTARHAAPPGTRVTAAATTPAGSSTTAASHPATLATGSGSGSGPVASRGSAPAGNGGPAPSSAAGTPTSSEAGRAPTAASGSGATGSGSGAPAGSDQGGTRLPDVALSLSPVGTTAGGATGSALLEAVAVVTADSSDGPGLPAPSGTVTFTVGGRPACDSVPLRGGRASCQVRGTTTEYVAAFYSGDAVYVGRGSYAKVG